MALFRSNLQVSSHNLANPKALIDLLNATRNHQNITCANAKPFFSWFKKAEPIKCVCRQDRSSRELGCKKRVPQCPEHICSGAPSRCLEEGYGRPIQLRKQPWYSFKTPKTMKQKPSNCPPPECPKELTFREYIFGVEKPLPDPTTCRRARKFLEINSVDDPRLSDPRYKATKGDVLIFSEPPKYKPSMPLAPTVGGPKPKPPPQHRPPNAVICKKISDSVAGLDCYCACVTIEKPPCQTKMCPLHDTCYRLPYDEMRPRNPGKKFFDCRSGVGPADNAGAPPSSQSCTCLHTVFARKAARAFPPAARCDFRSSGPCPCHGPAPSSKAEREGAAAGPREAVSPAPSRKMSRCERLKADVAGKESSVSLPQYVRRRKVACDSKCGRAAGACLSG